MKGKKFWVILFTVLITFWSFFLTMILYPESKTGDNVDIFARDLWRIGINAEIEKEAKPIYIKAESKNYFCIASPEQEICAEPTNPEKGSRKFTFSGEIAPGRWKLNFNNYFADPVRINLQSQEPFWVTSRPGLGPVVIYIIIGVLSSFIITSIFTALLYKD